MRVRFPGKKQLAKSSFRTPNFWLIPSNWQRVRERGRGWVVGGRASERGRFAIRRGFYGRIKPPLPRHPPVFIAESSLCECWCGATRDLWPDTWAYQAAVCTHISQRAHSVIIWKCTNTQHKQTRARPWCAWLMKVSCASAPPHWHAQFFMFLFIWAADVELAGLQLQSHWTLALLLMLNTFIYF